MNVRRGCAVCIAAVLGVLAGPVGALEISSGQIRLTLHEGIGRFSIACLTQASGGTYTPLLVAQDPRSSGVSLLVGDRIVRLGESFDFRESVEKTDEGARFVWTSRQLVVTEAFSFIGTPDSDVATGVRVDLRVQNVSEQDVAVAVRYLFDTWLGEASSVHFRTDTVAGLSRELTLTKDEHPAYWISPLADGPDGFGFECMLSGEGVTVPDRVVFANWKRLNDAPWSYTSSAARSFSQVPWSMNDSAVGQYYDARPVPRGGSVVVTLALGRASPAGLTLQRPAAHLAAAEAPAAAAAAPAATEATAVEPVSEPPATEAPAAEAAPVSPAPEASPAPPLDPVAAARADLGTLNGLLQQIDQLLGPGAAVTAEALAALEQALAALKEHAALYGSE